MPAANDAGSITGLSLFRNLSQRHIPSLDGLRGVSALTVTAGHVLFSLGITDGVPGAGDFAVVLFFEISGLLITWLLLNEQSRTGSIDRRSFMGRRSLRLFPAFYVFWLLSYLVPKVPGRWFAFFYLMDVFKSFSKTVTNETDLMGMAWSLGVEEKFYLVWPTILKRFHGPALLKGILICFLLAQAYHLLIHKLGYAMWAARNFDTRMDSVLLGAALAIAIKAGWRPPNWCLNRFTALLSLLAIVALSCCSWNFRLNGGVLLAAYPLAIILLSTIANPPRFLNNPIAAFFGKISYSLYLYNQMAVHFVSLLGLQNHSLHVGLCLLLALTAATLSYYVVERPFLRVKERLHKPVQITVLRAAGGG